jgi:hypothetical protein
VSVYELAMEDVVGATQRPDLLVIAAAGAETRLQQVTSSLLQRLQLAEPPWEESRRFGGGIMMPDSPPPDSWPANMQQQRQRQRSRNVAAAPRDRAMAEEDRSRQREARSRRSSVAQPQGIPIIRRTMPSERRDADGGFGDSGVEQAQAVPYDSWVQPEERQREPVSELAQGQPGGDAPRGRAFDPKEDLL